MWLIERDFQPPNTTFELLPDSYIEVVFSFGAPCRLATGATVRDLPPSYIVGLLRKPCYLHAHGLLKTFGVRFWAWGFAPLLGITVGHLPDAVRGLNTILQHVRARLEPYAEQNDDQAAVEHLHTLLLEQVLHTQFTDDEIRRAMQLLHTQRGSVKIAELADACHLSLRQLERNVHKTVGTSPKQLARTMRFEHVRDRLWQEPQADLAQLAYDMGYADQAHFTREFKQFSNRTPKQFAADIAATRAVLRAADVAFVQDP